MQSPFFSEENFMDLCRICGNPSYVLNAKMEKVPFRKNPDAKSFICGSCVADGYLKPKVKEPGDKQFDLKEWRKGKNLTQNALADKLLVSRVQISKVESGERVMPERWGRILRKMYPTHV
jgi:hypothetical protein